MNAYCAKLGFPSSLIFHDILGTDADLLGMVPRPCRAVLMLFPVKAASEAHRAAEAARIAAAGQVVAPALYYCSQTIDNACGTIALLHAVANLSTLTGGDVPLAPGSFFERFISSTLKASPAERAAALEADDSIDESHGEVAQLGQSDVVDDTHAHFIAFSLKDGHLYELDGRKDTPVNHGASSEDTFLEDAVAVIRAFMARDPEEVRFTMVALAPPE